MRLGKFREIISKALPRLVPKVGESGPNNRVIVNGTEFILALEELLEVPGLEEEVRSILSSTPRPDKKGRITLSSSFLIGLETALDNLTANAKHLQSMLDNTLPPPEKGTVFIKLPATTNISIVAEDMSTIDDCLNQVFSGTNLGLQIRFNGFEPGSVWLGLLIAGGNIGLALTFLNRALNIASKSIELQRQLIEVESAEIDLELKKAQSKIQKHLLDNLASRLAKEQIAQEGEDPNTPANQERISRIVNSLKRMSELFSRGANVDVPLITAAAFPESKELEKSVQQLGAEEKRQLITSPRDK
jgi:hypothetical protein